MKLQNKPYGLLSVFAFILAGGAVAYIYFTTSMNFFVDSFESVPGYLVIFFAVVGCMLAALSFFAKKK